MTVTELIRELETFPGDAWCDAMFPGDGNAYAVVGTDELKLQDGRVICVVEITDDVPLAVA